MIADDKPRWLRGMAPSSPAYSRRAFLVLAACGLTAACAAPGATVSGSRSATPVPTPLAPTGPITAASVRHLTKLAEFAPQNGRMRGVAWSPDGRILAVASKDIYTWDVVTGKKLGVWKGHTDQIYTLAWSPVTGLVASASDDNTARIWDPRDGSTVHVLPNPRKDSVISVAWSPDGAKLVTGTWQGTVEVWDSRTGQHLATWAGPAEEGGRGPNPWAVWGVAWSPDGSAVVSTRYDMHVLVWDAASGRLRGSLTPDSQPNGVAWAPDGSHFASSDDNGTIQLWDAHASYANTRTLRAREHVGWTYPLAWKQDGSLLACATSGGLVQLWDMSANTELTPLQAHQASIWGLALSPDATRLATACDDGTARVWGAR